MNLFFNPQPGEFSGQLGGDDRWSRLGVAIRRPLENIRLSVMRKGRMYTSIEIAHPLLEEKFGPVKQHPHITGQEYSPAVGRKIRTGQAESAHHWTRELTSCWKENSDRSSSVRTLLHEKTHRLLEENSDRSCKVHTSLDGKTHPLLEEKRTSQAASAHHWMRKLTCCWKKNSDRSSSVRTSRDEKTHPLLEEKFGQKIRTGQAASAHHRTRKLTGCWKKNSDRSSSVRTLLDENTHYLIEVKFGPVKQSLHITGRENSHTVGREKSDQSSSVCTSRDEKTHLLLEEKFEQVKQSPHITR
ncbi:hypothetical protein GGX14DRAFT_402677 [Mycena pura]|uniref:Uncharacterized protein n=1 Tax=Mycena pura TaxID=153505 RepID=A0AAD6V1W7_9AGAR|nr:hypothetical protein GGX14DRAFT_402677 [Mycena pura]